MTIILGILVPAVLFFITLPLQSFLFVLRQDLKAKEKKENKRCKGSLTESLGLTRLQSRFKESNDTNKNNKIKTKLKIMRIKSIRYLIKTISSLVTFLRTLASSIIVVVISAVVLLLPIFISIILSVSSIVIVLNPSKGVHTYKPSPDTVSTSSDTVSTSSDTVFTGNVSNIRYLQSNFSNKIAGNCTIAGGGCGWCSLTHMMINLNPEKCGNMSPADWLSVMPDKVKSHWSSGSMSWNAPRAWVNALNEIGTYGEYKVIFSYEIGSDRTKEILDYAKTYMTDSNTMMIISSSTGLFTGGGHIILLTSVSSDGKYFTITDSSNKAFRYLSDAGESVSSESMNSFKFPMNVTSLHGYRYNFKCCWVIKRIK